MKKADDEGTRVVTVVMPGHQDVCDCHACGARRAVLGTLDAVVDADPTTLLLIAEEIGKHVAAMRRAVDSAATQRIAWLRKGFQDSMPLLPYAILAWEKLAFACDFQGQRGRMMRDDMTGELAEAMAAKFGRL